jgi:hypothetical protein
MPTIERNDQPEDLTKDEKDSPSSEESNSSKVETGQIKQSGKVAAKKKTARKKAAKKAGGRMDSEKKKASPTRRKEVQSEASDSSKTETRQIKQSGKVAAKKKTARKKAAKKAGGRMDSAKKKASPTRRKETQPENPVEGSVSPAVAPPPQTRGGTGLMGFWIKAGASVFVIVAGVIGSYTFFSEGETTSRPEATQAAAGAQGDDASGAGRVVADTGTQQTNVVDPESSHGYRNEPGTFAGATVANGPAAGSAITAGVTPGVAPAADQPYAGQSDTAPEPAGYRPERYRPLEPEQDPPPPTQASTTNETPRATPVPAPYYYPQPGAYAYPPASYYGGYGRYYPY